jgi:hypothetical protein
MTRIVSRTEEVACSSVRAGSVSQRSSAGIDGRHRGHQGSEEPQALSPGSTVGARHAAPAGRARLLGELVGAWQPGQGR